MRTPRASANSIADSAGWTTACSYLAHISSSERLPSCVLNCWAYPLSEVDCEPEKKSRSDKGIAKTNAQSVGRCVRIFFGYRSSINNCYARSLKNHTIQVGEAKPQLFLKCGCRVVSGRISREFR